MSLPFTRYLVTNLKLPILRIPVSTPLPCRFAAARASVAARAAVQPSAVRPVVARFFSEELSPQDFDAKW